MAEGQERVKVPATKATRCKKNVVRARKKRTREPKQAEGLWIMDGGARKLGRWWQDGRR